MTSKKNNEHTQFVKDSVTIVYTLLRLLRGAEPTVDIMCNIMAARLGRQDMHGLEEAISSIDEASAKACYERLKSWQHDERKIIGYFEKYAEECILKHCKFEKEKKQTKKKTAKPKKPAKKKKPGDEQK